MRKNEKNILSVNILEVVTKYDYQQFYEFRTYCLWDHLTQITRYWKSQPNMTYNS